ncbi:MlaA family lipoprotein [Andreprevotia chitinilytica]|uniref:MlaA family lipoprotein n=1 Tax=Andreprevotia chitinilytica TaxID=396808 RepID=UPI00054D5EED|nr:VacJ family lipoprotein [Andreprevotia chitinilytica]
MRKLTLLSSTILALLLAGCATPQNNYDPLEPVNRKIFAVNMAVDRAVLKPVATAYSQHAPGPVKQATHGFFDNIDDFFSVLGNLAQGKFSDAFQSAGRVAVNTTVGMFGFVDWASDMGLKKTNEDLGQALGHWGVGSGPFLMLPFFGPSSARDLINPVSRYYLDPYAPFSDPSTAVTIFRYGMAGVSARADLLPLDPMIESQIDPYAYIRDAWLQKRYNDVWDGNPPKPLDMGGGPDDGPDDAAPGAPADKAQPAAVPDAKAPAVDAPKEAPKSESTAPATDASKPAAEPVQ